MLRYVLAALMAAVIQWNLFATLAQAADSVEPILVKGTDEYKFRTRIRKCVAEKGVNFNHHFTVCTIGQGTDVQINFLIDQETGKVKLIMTSELGVAVSPDSDILVVNPVFWMSPGDPVPSWLWRKVYQYDAIKGDFILVKKDQEQSARPAN